MDLIIRPAPNWLRLGFFAIAAGCLLGALPSAAQDASQIVDEAALNQLTQPDPAAASSIDGDADKPAGIDILSLISKGGIFMIPIGVMSLLVVTLGAERLFALRGGRMVPWALNRKLEMLADPIDTFDPEVAYQACRRYPSPTARVVASLLLRTGRPLAEIERTAAEAAQREADRLAGPIRWLYLATAITPLMGLLGTVWGMIRAFHDTTQLAAGQNKAEYLAEGIYVALVTTLAGLIVAIPAAILAHHFEGCLTRAFHRIEEICFLVAPGLERFNGRMRLDFDGRLVPLTSAKPPVAPPAERPSKKSPGMSGKTSATPVR
ncbi:Biopolymer transport protein ExbB [Rosistilla ulvae]|uniref:Biopolymer transport protein ExbB n=1 Tax=Rosistilla ulvae TaxID=1930277 RepID=A0A517LUA2_9BACT|nr:MotA/TolQ/ExbB proton channel family protein [Rosistilla ulvae]QDS86201.1 Biopolymer transport protein ExbB [Rosistilla ulvae]